MKTVRASLVDETHEHAHARIVFGSIVFRLETADFGNPDPTNLPRVHRIQGKCSDFIEML